MLETPAKGHFYVIKVHGMLKCNCSVLTKDRQLLHLASARVQDQGNVIAQLMITFEWSDWRAKDIWWIQSVYVNPTYRRQGLFTALYKHAQEESRKAGACGLRLYADTGNERAHKTVCTPNPKILTFSPVAISTQVPTCSMRRWE